jgi:transposase
MIALPTGTQIWIAAGVTDMRRGVTGLSAQVQTVLKESPFSGHVFVFRGRRGDLIKMMWWDSCCVPDYVELKDGDVIARDRDWNQLHIIG